MCVCVCVCVCVHSYKYTHTHTLFVAFYTLCVTLNILYIFGPLEIIMFEPVLMCTLLVSSVKRQEPLSGCTLIISVLLRSHCSAFEPQGIRLINSCYYYYFYYHYYYFPNESFPNGTITGNANYKSAARKRSDVMAAAMTCTLTLASCSVRMT